METQVVEYNKALGLKPKEDLFEAFKVMADRFKDLKITDSKSDTMAHSSLATVKSKRTAVEARRLLLNREERDKVKGTIEKNNKNAGIIQTLIAKIEEPLQIECKRADKEKADRKAKKDREEQERVDGIRQKITSIQRMASNLSGCDTEYLNRLSDESEKIEITEAEYMEFTGEATNVLTETYVAIQDFIVDRQKFEKEEGERKAEAVRLAEQKKEQEAEQAKIDEQNRILAGQQAAALDKIKAKEDAAQYNIDYVEASLMNKEIDFDRKQEAEAQKKRDKKIADDAADKALQDAKDKEKEDKEESERKAALLPDKMKFKQFANDLKDLNPPDIVAADSHKLFDEINFRIADLVEYIIKEAKAL